jgi:hypothetical protein
MHRFLMGLDFGDRREVDHINGDKLDNRRANLRVVTHAQNGQNVRISIPRTSSYRGVYWITARGRWAAKAKLNGQDVWIGLFDDEREAALAAEAYRRSHMPFAEPDPLLAQEEFPRGEPGPEPHFAWREKKWAGGQILSPAFYTPRAAGRWAAEHGVYLADDDVLRLTFCEIRDGVEYRAKPEDATKALIEALERSPEVA